MNKLLFHALALTLSAVAAAGDTLLDEQFCQHYYTLGDGKCPEVRSKVRSEVRGNGTPTLEMGDRETQPAMVFLHGWPDTSAIWANQFAEFCGDYGGHFCVAPSWIDFHPDFPRADDSKLLWSNQVEAFHAVVDDLGLTDVTLVIFDFGAVLGYQFAYRYPDLVGRVVGLDIGLSPPLVIGPFPAIQSFLPKYQQNNIEAFLADDDEAMRDNLETELEGLSPCHDCRIAPPPPGAESENATADIGVGARTGWPYYNIVQTDKPWPSFFDVPLDEWEWSTVPSFPDGVPLLFLYSSEDFHDASFRDWIDGRGDGVSAHAQMEDTDHWLQVRVPEAVNAKIADWMIVAAEAGVGSTTSTAATQLPAETTSTMPPPTSNEPADASSDSSRSAPAAVVLVIVAGALWPYFGVYAAI